MATAIMHAFWIALDASHLALESGVNHNLNP
jgi:hypothetical protein